MRYVVYFLLYDFWDSEFFSPAESSFYNYYGTVATDCCDFCYSPLALSKPYDHSLCIEVMKELGWLL